MEKLQNKEPSPTLLSNNLQWSNTKSKRRESKEEENKLLQRKRKIEKIQNNVRADKKSTPPCDSFEDYLINYRRIKERREIRERETEWERKIVVFRL